MSGDPAPLSASIRVTSYGAHSFVPALIYFAVCGLTAFVLYDVAGPLGLLGTAIAVVSTYLLVARTVASAGPDGLEIFMLADGRQSFPYDAIAEVVFAGKSVHVILITGERIPVARNAVIDGSDLAALAERIREGTRGHHLVANPTLAVLARGERNVADWLRDLRAATTPGSYRQNAPTSEALWGVLEDPAADLSARAAAGVALGGTSETAPRTRIAAIATTVTSPRLRIALETIASGPDHDELLGEQLEDVDMESACPAR